MSNQVEEDFLDVDKSIPGQNYACISFVSPEKILLDKQFIPSFKVSKLLKEYVDNSIKSI